eukprot:gene45212-18443_t
MERDPARKEVLVAKSRGLRARADNPRRPQPQQQ